MKRVLIILAEGFEEIEAITSIDLLRRAEFEVTTASVASLEVCGAHHQTLIANEELSLKKMFDAIVIPGGMPGATNIANSSIASELISKHYREGKLIAAICAAPAVVLGPLGILEKRRFTCYPGFENEIAEGIFEPTPVVVDGTVITSGGPATAMAFALEVINQLDGTKTSEKIAEQILFKM